MLMPTGMPRLLAVPCNVRHASTWRRGFLYGVRSRDIVPGISQPTQPRAMLRLALNLGLDVHSSAGPLGSALSAGRVYEGGVDVIG